MKKFEQLEIELKEMYKKYPQSKRLKSLDTHLYNEQHNKDRSKLFQNINAVLKFINKLDRKLILHFQNNGIYRFEHYQVFDQKDKDLYLIRSHYTESSEYAKGESIWSYNLLSLLQGGKYVINAKSLRNFFDVERLERHAYVQYKTDTYEKEKYKELHLDFKYLDSKEELKSYLDRGLKNTYSVKDYKLENLLNTLDRNKALLSAYSLDSFIKCSERLNEYSVVTEYILDVEKNIEELEVIKHDFVTTLDRDVSYYNNILEYCKKRYTIIDKENITSAVIDGCLQGEIHQYGSMAGVIKNAVCF